jgi:SAM-dependent methyltransferase
MRLRRSSGQDWDDLARTEPLWAVLTDERYRSTRITSASEQDFWQSGESYVRHVADLCVTHFGRSLVPRQTLDFGCGVGRLLVPLARLSGKAVGIDVSPAMLAHARAACDRAGLSNVSLQSCLPSGPDFDFVNSALVLQHIPVRDGLLLLDQLLACLAPGGFLALQILYGRPGRGLLKRTGRWLYSNVRPVRPMLGRSRGGTPGTPYMQMNAYPLEQVFGRLAKHGVSDLHVILTNESGFRSALIVGAKSARATQDGAT